VLELGCNALGDAGAATLAQYWEQLGSLQLLGLGSNGIGADGARALFGGLSGSSNNSISSSTRKSGGGRAGIGSGSTATEERQQVLPALCVLQLCGNFIGDAGAAALAAVMPVLQQLRQLELQENYSISVVWAFILLCSLQTRSGPVHLLRIAATV
jgi:hypothetical protein